MDETTRLAESKAAEVAGDSKEPRGATVWRKLDTVFVTMSVLMAILAGVAILIAMALVCFTVISRAVGGPDIRTVEETVGYLTMFSVFVGLGHTYRVGGHVRSDLFIRKLSGPPRRILDGIAVTVALGFSIVLLLSTATRWLEKFRAGTLSESRAVLEWIPEAFMVLGCFWLVVEVVAAPIVRRAGRQSSADVASAATPATPGPIPDI